MNIWDENQAPGLLYLHFLKMTFWYEEKTWKGRDFSCLEYQLSQAQQNSCCETAGGAELAVVPCSNL